MKALLVLLALLLGACASMNRVDPGEHLVGSRMLVTPDQPWNEFDRQGEGPTVWTLEGLVIDQLSFYVDVKSGDPIPMESSASKDKKVLFQSSMQGEELFAMFQTVLTRDGSTLTLDRLEPASFVGGKGIRFEFSMVRKADNVQLAGVGYAAVAGNELFAVIYRAPRLGFFPRHQRAAEAIARSARLKT